MVRGMKYPKLNPQDTHHTQDNTPVSYALEHSFMLTAHASCRDRQQPTTSTQCTTCMTNSQALVRASSHTVVAALSLTFGVQMDMR